MLQILRKAGILGLNRRNREYLLRCNERRFFPLVDDKLATKRLCQAKGIPVPEILAVAEHHFEISGLIDALAEQESFALKPASANGAAAGCRSWSAVSGSAPPRSAPWIGP